MSDFTPTDDNAYWRHQAATRPQIDVYQDTFERYLRDQNILPCEFQFGLEPVNAFLNVLRWADPRWAEVGPTGLKIRDYKADYDLYHAVRNKHTSLMRVELPMEAPQELDETEVQPPAAKRRRVKGSDETSTGGVAKGTRNAKKQIDRSPDQAATIKANDDSAQATGAATTKPIQLLELR